MTPPARSGWLAVIAATGAGVAAALHLGKAAIALPAIRAEFGTSVAGPAFYIAAISLVAATAGIVMGRLTARIGPRRAALGGLALIAAGSVLGALAGGFQMLLFSRMVEAAGFPLIVTSIPPILQGVTPKGRQSLVLGIWSAWLPLGVALSLLLSLFLMGPFGWRGFFVGCAVLTVLAAVALVRSVPPDVAAQIRPAPLLAMLRQSERRLWTVTGCFLLFSLCNLLILGFLPSIVVESMGLSPSLAVIIPTMAVLTMVPSNILTGWVMDRGAGMRGLFGIAFVVIAAMAVILFQEGLPTGLRVAAVVGYALAAGVPPTLAWSSVPSLCAGRAGVAPVVSGVLYQGAALGQVIGPVAGGLAVDHAGHWNGALPVVVGACICATILSLAIPLWQRSPPSA